MLLWAQQELFLMSAKASQVTYNDNLQLQLHTVDPAFHIWFTIYTVAAQWGLCGLLLVPLHCLAYSPAREW